MGDERWMLQAQSRETQGDEVEDNKPELLQASMISKAHEYDGIVRTY